VRVMVVRHSASAPGKNVPVGKRVGEWVYELFITRLWAEGFLVEDVLDLYQGRGAVIAGRARRSATSRRIPIAGVAPPSVARTVAIRLSMGVEPATYPRADDAGRPARGCTRRPGEPVRGEGAEERKVIQ
jgi:hypothetical protein